MSRSVAAVLVALLAVVTGCTSSGHSDAGPHYPKNPDHATLVKAARLEPCPPSVPEPAAQGLPDITLPCLGNGPAVHMAGLRGTPTLLNVWGSWCGPCQEETPFLSQAHARLGSKVRFLGVDTEDKPDSALDFAAHVRPPMRYPSVVDDNKAILLGVHGPGVPFTVFVDATGHVVHLRTGAAYDSVGAVLADVAKYLGVRP